MKNNFKSSLKKDRFGYIQLDFDSQFLLDLARRKIFGSEINFKNYKESRDDFPEGYKFCREGILKGFIRDEDTLLGILKNIQKVENKYQPRFKRKVSEAKFKSSSEEKGASAGISSDLFEKLVSIDLDSKHGKRGVSTKRNPLDYRTYKARVSVVQSLARGAKIIEEIVSDIAEDYTEKYNKKFKTNFVTYHSKKRN